MTAIAALSAELRQLVDQFETDWREDRTIRWQTAEDLRQLRARAEALLGAVG